MNQSDLIQSISLQSGLSQVHAASFLKAFMNSVEQALEQGDDVVLVGFGRFSVLERPERNGVNPQTMQPMRIGPTKSVTFKPGVGLRRRIK